MNTPNLSALLSKPADDIKAPVSLPEGTYFGVVKDQAFVQLGKNKTDAVQYRVGLTHAHDDVDLTDYESEGGKPLPEREVKVTQWLSEDAQYRLVDFVKSFGVDTAGRSLGELIPQVVGQPIILEIVQKPTQDGQSTFNEVRKAVGAQSAA